MGEDNFDSKPDLKFDLSELDLSALQRKRPMLDKGKDFLMEPKAFQPTETESSFPPVHEEAVEQNVAKVTVVSPDDKDVHITRTHRRIGCDAVCLWLTQPDGTERFMVTHFDPDHVEDHLKAIDDEAPSGEGERHAAYLTFGEEGEVWRQRMEAKVNGWLGDDADVICLPDLSTDDLPDMAKDNTLYQMVAVRGYGGDPSKRRIAVPGTDFEKIF